MSQAAPPPPDRELAALRSLAIDKGSAPALAGRRPRRGLRAIVVIAAILLAWWWFQRATAVPVVETGRVLRSSPVADAEITTANGYVVARTRASVASKMQGRLVAVLVDEGEVVTAGQVLAEVEHAEQDAEVEEATALRDRARAAIPARSAELLEAEAAHVAAEAVLAERRAQVDEVRAVVAEREASFERTAALFAKQIAGQAELDQAREARDVARARVELGETALQTAQTQVARVLASVEVARQQLVMAHHDITAAEAALQRATAMRDNAFITAPFSGMVLRRDAEPGEVVSPANTGASGSKTAVVTLADFATLEVEVDVYERDIARVLVDTPCKVVLDAYPKEPCAGRVRLLRPTADRTRATIQVYVEFAAVPPAARPEMGARVVFYRSGTDVLVPDTVTVPAGALTTRDGRRGVFALTGKQVRFRALEVDEPAAAAGRAVVRSGIEPDELVVLEPDGELADGDEVVTGDAG